LARAGANEALNYSFVHGDILQKADQDIQNSYSIVNSISPDLQYYRQTLMPSLLSITNPNIRQGYDEFALFEINKTHQKQDKLTNENVPVESDMLALVVTNKNTQDGAAYYQAKRILDYLCDSFGMKLAYSVIDNETNDALTAPFEYRRSARVTNMATGLSIGIVGEFKKSVMRNFKLSEHTAGFEVNTRDLFEAARAVSSSYRPISRYPAAERDICFQVRKEISYREIIEASNMALDNIQIEINILPIDIYQPEMSETKNITIRVKLISHDRTLTSGEVAKTISIIVESVTAKTGAAVI
jgi:phenylalanyl-tRNA synthetase beta chain